MRRWSGKKVFETIKKRDFLFVLLNLEMKKKILVLLFTSSLVYSFLFFRSSSSLLYSEPHNMKMEKANQERRKKKIQKREFSFPILSFRHILLFLSHFLYGIFFIFIYSHPRTTIVSIYAHRNHTAVLLTVNCEKKI